MSIELDLHGERVALGEADVEWLLERARPRVGSSSPLGELVTMLDSARADVRARQRLVVLRRSDVNALRSLFAGDAPASPALDELRALLRVE